VAHSWGLLTVGIADSSVANRAVPVHETMVSEFGWSRTLSLGHFHCIAGGSLLSMSIGPLIDKQGPRLVLAWERHHWGVPRRRFLGVPSFGISTLFRALPRAVMVGRPTIDYTRGFVELVYHKRGRAIGICLCRLLDRLCSAPAFAQWADRDRRCGLHGWLSACHCHY